MGGYLIARKVLEMTKFDGFVDIKSAKHARNHFKKMNSINYNSIVGLAVLLASCATKPTEQPTLVALDTTKYQKVDSVADVHYKVLDDTVLTIKADSVQALYYPNTGRVVMTLKKKDVCTITLQKDILNEIRNKFPFWKDADQFIINNE